MKTGSVLGALPSGHQDRRGQKLPGMSLICFPLERASVLTSLLVLSVCLSTGSEACSGNECQGIALGTEAALILSISHSCFCIICWSELGLEPAVLIQALKFEKTEHFTGVLRNDWCPSYSQAHKLRASVWYLYFFFLPVRHPRICWSVRAEDWFLTSPSTVRPGGFECRSVWGGESQVCRTHRLSLQTFLHERTFPFFPGVAPDRSMSQEELESSVWMFMACGYFDRIQATVLLPLGTLPDLDLWPEPCALWSLCWSWWRNWEECRPRSPQAELQGCTGALTAAVAWGWHQYAVTWVPLVAVLCQLFYTYCFILSLTTLQMRKSRLREINLFTVTGLHERLRFEAGNIAKALFSPLLSLFLRSYPGGISYSFSGEWYRKHILARFVGEGRVSWAPVPFPALSMVLSLMLRCSVLTESLRGWYRQTSFYCSSLCYSSHIAFFKNWTFVATLCQVYWRHFPSICSPHVSVTFW